LGCIVSGPATASPVQAIAALPEGDQVKALAVTKVALEIDQRRLQRMQLKAVERTRARQRVTAILFADPCLARQVVFANQ
jgi:hypothetical protein